MKVVDDNYRIVENVVMERSEDMITYEHALYLLAERLNVNDKDLIRKLIDTIMCNSHNAHLQSSKKINELLEKLNEFIGEYHGDTKCRELTMLLNDRSRYDMKEMEEFFGEKLLFG